MDRSRDRNPIDRFPAAQGRRADTASLPPLLARVARAAPDAEALASPGLRLTYRQLYAEVHRLAGALAARGVGRGSLVAVNLPRAWDLVAAILAVHHCGAAYLPLDPALPARRREQLLATADVRLVIDRDWLEATAYLAPAEHARDPAVVSPDDLAYAIFTSGSTGRPKPVAVPHGPLARHAHAVLSAYGLSHGDRVLQFANPAFDVFGEELFPTLLAGATLVVPDASIVSPTELAAYMREGAVTVANLPTPYWEQWVRDLDAGRGDVPSSLRLLIVGSDVGYTETLDTWWRHCDVTVINAYGLTETTITSAIHVMTPGTRPAGRMLPTGGPLPGVQIHLLDDELKPVADGSDGEVYVGGSLLARGYASQPALTAERFVPDPYSAQPGARLFRTGDRATRRPDGALELLGRTDDQVKIRGQRVELGEIVAVLRDHPAVRDAYVRAADDPSGGKRLIAYVTPDTVETRHLRSHLADRLPAVMVPSVFVRLSELPRTGTGKVDHRALPNPDDITAAAQTNDATPRPESDGRDALEARIAAIWCDVLRTDHVGLDDGFFDIGGHSLLLVKVQRRLATELGHQVSGVALFAYPTVRSLAAHLRAEDGPDTLVPDVPKAEAGRVRDQRARVSLRQRQARFVTPGSIDNPLQQPLTTTE